MLEISQGLLWAATALITFAFVAYVLAVVTARTAKKAAVRQQVLVGDAGQSLTDSHDADAGSAAPAASALKGRSITWYGSVFTIVALVLLSGSMIARMFSTGHAPFANHYEFAVSFAWGMVLAQVYFEWRYRVRTLALIVLPVILAMLVYASTLSYEAQPLMPALQNSPLLTMHVFAAALAYGAAVVAFAAAVMFLLAPRVKWQGWPKPETLDELGYKAVVVTFPLLTIMIILGAIWANIAWGRYWSWDPKETAALVTWIIYGAYLHARVVRDWRGARSAWLLVLGFAAILFTYFGNLFFGGLHAYA